MPGNLDRHARGKDDWDAPPSRSAEVRAAMADDPEPSRAAPARKDKRRWCKGKPGREHNRGLVLSTHYSWIRRPAGCGWASRWSIKTEQYELTWSCRHQDVCLACGRVFREPCDLAPGECPAYPGDPAQRAEAEALVARDQENRRIWLAPHRQRVITGPQGYRRPKARRGS